MGQRSISAEDTIDTLAFTGCRVRDTTVTSSDDPASVWRVNLRPSNNCYGLYGAPYVYFSTELEFIFRPSTQEKLCEEAVNIYLGVGFLIVFPI